MRLETGACSCASMKRRVQLCICEEARADVSEDVQMRMQLHLYLAVVQLAQLLDDPLFQHESLPQLFPVVLHRDFALLLLHRVVSRHRAVAHAAHTGCRLKEYTARGRGDRRGRLGTGGGHGAEVASERTAA